MIELLYSKGARLAQMSKLGPPVPSGFISTTDVAGRAWSLQSYLRILGSGSGRALRPSWAESSKGKGLSVFRPTWVP